MGIKERKKREKQKRRDQILNAAEKVIFAKGLERSTMTEIAEQAELSKGTLYLYFKNKNELYIAIAERGSDKLNNKFAKVFADDSSGLQLIRKIGETYLHFVRDNAGYFDAFQYYETLNDEEELLKSDIAASCEENRRGSLSFMVRALQIGMQDGTIDDSYDPRQLAVMLWSSTRGITVMNYMKETGHYFKVLDEMEIETETLFDDFLKMVGTGIATKDARTKWVNGSH